MPQTAVNSAQAITVGPFASKWLVLHMSMFPSHRSQRRARGTRMAVETSFSFTHQFRLTCQLVASLLFSSHRSQPRGDGIRQERKQLDGCPPPPPRRGFPIPMRFQWFDIVRHHSLVGRPGAVSRLLSCNGAGHFLVGRDLYNIYIYIYTKQLDLCGFEAPRIP